MKIKVRANDNLSTAKEKLPQDDAHGHADIERMLGAGLRDLHAQVGLVHDVLPHAVHLIAEHDGIAAVRLARQRSSLRRAGAGPA